MYTNDTKTVAPDAPVVLVERQHEKEEAENIPVFIASVLCAKRLAFVRASVLYESYGAWCREMGAWKIADSYLFGRELTAYGFLRRQSHGVVYQDVAFRDVPLEVLDDVLCHQVQGTTDEAGMRREWAERNRKRLNGGRQPMSFSEFHAKQYGRKESVPKTSAKIERKFAEEEAAQVKDRLMSVWASASLVRAPGVRRSVPGIYSNYADWSIARSDPYHEFSEFPKALERVGYTILGRGTRASLAQYDLAD